MSLQEVDHGREGRVGAPVFPEAVLLCMKRVENNSLIHFLAAESFKTLEKVVRKGYGAESIRLVVGFFAWFGNKNDVRLSPTAWGVVELYTGFINKIEERDKVIREVGEELGTYSVGTRGLFV